MAPETIPEVCINMNSCQGIYHDNHPNWHQKCKWLKVRAPHVDEMPVDNFLLGSIHSFLPSTKFFPFKGSCRGSLIRFSEIFFRFLDTHDWEIISGIFPKYSITKPTYWSTTLNWLRLVLTFVLSLVKTVDQSETGLKTFLFLIQKIMRKINWHINPIFG